MCLVELDRNSPLGTDAYWELITITAEIYADQLSRVQAALIEKQPATVNRKGIILLHDNARPHIAKLTLKKISELGWEVLRPSTLLS